MTRLLVHPMSRILKCHTILLVCGLLLFSSSLGQESLECEGLQTKITSPWIYVPNGPPCHQIVSEYPNIKHMGLRRECQRWYGTARMPDSLGNYKVTQCFTHRNRTTQYRADICCEDEVARLRCFTCVNSKNDYDCAYHNDPQTCDANQVCQTTVSYRNMYPFTERRKANACTDRATCESLASLNSRTCRGWNPNPSCVYCCDETFCNLNTPSPIYHAAENECVSSPCSNGGTCVLDGMVDLGYHCTCPNNYNGTWCEINLNIESPFAGRAQRYPCDNRPCQHQAMCVNQGSSFRCMCKQGYTGIDCSIEHPLCRAADVGYCLNGGTCLDHSVYGLRCRCPTGFLGTRCELPMLQCKYPASTWTSAYKMFVNFGEMACTERVQQEDARNLYDSYKLRQCKERMAPLHAEPFRDNMDGEVVMLEGRSLWMCMKGDQYAEYSEIVCCPSCYSLPCLNGGWCMQLADGDYVCKCRFGWEGKNCETKPALCVVTGDPHYVTFDGTVITSQGTCMYEVSSLVPGMIGDWWSFKLLVRSLRRAGTTTKISFPNKLIFTVLNLEITIAGDYVEVDGEEVALEARFGNIRISWNGRFIRIDTPQGVVVEYDTLFTVVLKVPQVYNNKLQGMCGNMDGDPDYPEKFTKQGQYMYYRQANIARSWQVLFENAPAKCRRTRKKRQAEGGIIPEEESLEDDEEDEEDDFTPTCDEATTNLIASRTHCGLIKEPGDVFKDCILDPQAGALREYENCFYDACATAESEATMKQVACSSVEVFAFTCQTLGYIVNWRQRAQCEPECPEGMIYKQMTVACRPTCGNPNAARECALPDRENCVCPNGLIFYKDKCIEPSECGCMDVYGQKHEIGDQWTTADCSKMFRCVECTTCEYRVGTLQEADMACQPYEQCVYDPLVQIGACVVNVICPEGMYFSPMTSACPATCQDPDAPLTCPDSIGVGCACPPGLVQQDNVCMDPSECSCLHGTDSQAEIGSMWLSVDCTTQYTCVPCNECMLSVAIVEQAAHQCDVTQICVPTSDTHAECINVPECPSGMVYQPAGPYCLPTCDDPGAETGCHQAPREGCVCEPGLVYKDGQCVQPGICGCVGNHNCVVQMGHTWLSDDCTVAFTCVVCDTCLLPVGAVVSIDHQCEADEMCVMSGNDTGACQKVDCPNGLIYDPDASPCPATCADPGGGGPCWEGILDSCRCPAGLVHSNSACMDPTECGCDAGYGEKVEIGTSWMSTDCNTMNTCEPCAACPLPVGVIAITPSQCPDAHKCLSDGVLHGICVPDCPDGMTYEQLTSSCPASCDDPNAELTCLEVPGPGCACPQGMVRKGDLCIDPNMCSCVNPLGNEIEIGTVWLSADCTELNKCEPCVACVYPVGVFKQEAHSCADHQQCVATGQNMGRCIVVPDCPSDMVYSLTATSCHPTCGDPGAAQDCELPREPGCMCPGDMVVNDGVCTGLDECPCSDNVGMEQTAGSTWLSLDCTKVYQCFPCVDCPFPVPVLTTEEFQCDDGELCMVDAEVARCVQVPECPAGQVYSLTASACPATCATPDAPQNCPLNVFEGCTCPDALVIKDNMCVSPEECGCTDDFGVTREIGETWLSDGCATQYRCDVCVECQLPVGRIGESPYECTEGYACTMDAWVHICMEVPQCPAGQIFRTSLQRCPATCADPDAPLRCLGQFINMEGCECEQGLLLNALGNCVLPESCGCVSSNGAENKIGSVWLSDDCSSLLRCDPCLTCSRPVGRVQERPFTCDPDRSCVLDDTSTWSCRQIPTCPAVNQVYSLSAPGCPPTCADPNAPAVCVLPTQEACVCERGTILNAAGDCVNPRDCGCVYEGVLTFKIGTSWLSENCETQYQCSPCLTCPLPVGEVVEAPYTCRDGYMCVVYDNQLGVCQKIPDCPENQTYSMTAPACPPTCAEPDAEVTCVLAPEPGCTCPPQFVRDGNECIDPGDCNCVDENIVFKVGSKWLTPDCGTEYSCTPCADCAYPVSRIVETPYECGDDSMCILDGSGFTVCEKIPECPEGQVYSLTATGCPATCYDPGAPSACLLPTLSACGCEEGLLLSNGTCVPPEGCACTGDSGQVYQIGTTWLSVDCIHEYTCVPCAACVLPVGRATETEFSCGDGSLCLVDEFDNWKCIEAVPCAEGMTFSLAAPACPPTCTDPGAPLTCGLPAVEGCMCYSGLVLEADQCVRPETCQCTDEYGNVMGIGSSWMSPTCAVFYSCVACAECALPVATMVNQTTGCGENYNCATDGIVQIGQCVQECRPGMIYDFEASACPATCQDADAPQNCNMPNIGNCACPVGKVLDRAGDCVEPDQCACFDSFGRSFQIGTTWMSDDCRTEYQCITCPLCSLPVGQLESADYQCDPDTLCTQLDQGLGICTPLPDCPIDMAYSLAATACPATCDDPAAPSTCLLPNIEGCTCFPGFVLDNGACINPTQCKCSDSYGNKFQIGTSWLSPDCLREYHCVQCNTCTLAVGVVVTREHSCTVVDVCYLEPVTSLGSCVPAPDCPAGMTYSATATGCPATCQKPDAPLNCPLPNIPGCTCAPGLVMEGLVCVDTRRCPCTDEYGNIFEVGALWLSRDCTSQYQCVTCDTCYLPVGAIVARQHWCMGNEICSLDQNMVGTCIQGPECPAGFQYNPQGSTCPATCEDPDAPVRCPTPEEPGCVCPDEMVIGPEGECISPYMCRCLDPQGAQHEVGRQWLSADCTVEYRCVSCEQCSLPVARLVQLNHQCPPSTACEFSATGTGRCNTVAGCPPTMVPSTPASRCTPTCMDPEPPAQCTPGRCTCPQGTVLNGGICTQPTQCTCTDIFGRQFQVGTRWRSPDCRILYTCVTCGTCVLPVPEIVSQVEMCEATQTCVNADTDYGSCRDAPTRCPPGLVYSLSVSACPATCTDPDAPLRCPVGNTDGCACPVGAVLRDGVCVQPNSCGCFGDDGREYQLGDQWLSRECSVLNRCNVCDTCFVGVTVVTQTAHSCQPPEICSLDNNGNGVCVPEDPEDTFVYLNQFQFLVVTFNGAVVQSGDTVVVTQGVLYTFAVSDSTNVYYASIALRKVADTLYRGEQTCTNVPECSSQYTFDDRDRQARETRLEAVVYNGPATKELYIICKVQPRNIVVEISPSPASTLSILQIKTVVFCLIAAHVLSSSGIEI